MGRDRRMQRPALLCAAAVSLLLLAGCNTRTQTAFSISDSRPDDLNASAPVTVKNAAGEDITVRSAPQRIVVLPNWEAEMVLDLVDTNRVAALSSSMDSPLKTACADKAAKVSVRVTGEAEAIVSLKPDLVLLDTHNDGGGSLTQALREAGIPVLTLASPVSVDDIRDRLNTVSAAVYAPDKGREIVRNMDARLAAVKAKVSSVAQPVKVMFYDEYYSKDGTDAGKLNAYGEGSPFDTIAAAAGAVNVCTAANNSAVGKETVVNDWKPDLLIVPGVTYDENGPVADGGDSMRAVIKNDSALQSLPAVQDGRIIALSEQYRSSTSQYMVNAVEELAKACYPALFN